MRKNLIATLLQDHVVGILRMDYYAGISNGFTRLEQLNDALLEAEFVLNVSENGSDSDRIHYFLDYTLDFMLHECVSRIPVQSLYSNGLAALFAYDRRKGTEHAKTLAVLLENEMNFSRTAEALFIHRSSLMKRMNKIYQLLGSDLSGPNERLYLRLCFALERNQNRSPEH